jgi:hypothetical protein
LSAGSEPEVLRVNEVFIGLLHNGDDRENLIRDEILSALNVRDRNIRKGTVYVNV